MAYVGGPAAVSSIPCSKVELRIQCQNLLDRDITSKSDPCAVLMMKTSKGKWHEIGRTENIQNCLNPQFTRSFEIDYYFEEVQNLYIAVYDIDNKTPELDDDDFLGGIECTMGQVVSGSPFTKGLVKKNGAAAGKGKITITMEELEGSNDLLQLSFRAEHLDKKDFLGKSDPFLEFSREVGSGNWQVIHRTEVVKNNLNPTWKTFEVPVQKLCRGNQDLPIKVECHDYDNDGSHDFIGSFSTTVNQLMKAVDTQLKWPAINPKKKAKKKSYKDSGVIHLTSCKVVKQYSFLEFVFGGMQINFTVGIDFTASNGDPRSPQSLHYINPYEPNEYMNAIQSVGAVVQDYDSDKLFPALGFGARIPPNMQISHEFAINFNMQNPFCAGVQGIMQAYQQCIAQVQLYGPTNFSPIINHVARFAANAQKEEGGQNYFILLILTDGAISDMDQTRQAIVYASQLPMSIIIVGVGRADFTAMNILDGDDGVLKAPSGDRVRRDIVQFVPFRDFIQAPPAELAKNVLAEVPKQVTDYFKMMGIVPNPRPAGVPGQS